MAKDGDEEELLEAHRRFRLKQCEGRTVSYVLSYCLPIEIMTLIRKRLLAPELGKVAYAYRNAGHACALKGAWNSAGKTVHEALVEHT